MLLATLICFILFGAAWGDDLYEEAQTELPSSEHHELHTTGELPADQFEEAIAEAFKQLDSNGDNRLNVTELVQEVAPKTLGTNLTADDQQEIEAQLGLLFRELDVDKDHHFDLKEFTKFVLQDLPQEDIDDTQHWDL